MALSYHNLPIIQCDPIFYKVPKLIEKKDLFGVGLWIGWEKLVITQAKPLIFLKLTKHNINRLAKKPTLQQFSVKIWDPPSLKSKNIL